MPRHEDSGRQQVRLKAIEILKKSPEGIRYAQLCKELKKRLPEISPSTIEGAIWNLDACSSDEVYKPEKGLFRHAQYKK
jgi:hypothetical protein